MFLAITIVFFIGFLILALRNLHWAILFTIIALPTYLIRFQVAGIPFTLLEGMILIIFGVWLLHRIKSSEKKKIAQLLGPFLLPTSLFLIAATIAVFVSPDIRAAAGIWKAFIIEPILFALVLIDTNSSKKDFQNIIKALALSLVIPGVLAIYQKFTGVFIPNEFWQDAATRRVTSVYGYPNAIGLYFAPIVILLIGKAVTAVKPLSAKAIIVPGTIAIIGLLSIVFAQSKGALLGIGAGLLFCALFWKGKRVWFSGLFLVGLVAGLLHPSLNTLTGNSLVVGGGSLETRISQWKETAQFLMEHPIVGAGLAGYQSAIEPFHANEHIEIFLYPHNIVLNFWVETGLLGLIAILWLIIVFFKYVFKEAAVTPFNIILGGAMTTLIVHGLVDVPFFKNDLSILFWVLLSLALIALTIKMSEQSLTE